jgi:hypothetical protein
MDGLEIRPTPYIRLTLPHLANATSASLPIPPPSDPPISPSGTFLYPTVHAIHTMASDAPRLSLLEELDARQNELLDELERLNSRIEKVLQSCLTGQLEPQPVRIAAG